MQTKLFVLASAVCCALLGGCAVVTVAGAAAGAAISITGAAVGATVSVTGKVIGKTIDAVTPDAPDKAQASK